MGLPGPRTCGTGFGPRSAGGLQGAAPPAPVAGKPGSVSPVLAFILGFIPGLGAIYNGEYNKAMDSHRRLRRLDSWHHGGFWRRNGRLLGFRLGGVHLLHGH